MPFVDALRERGGPITGGNHQKINTKLAIITLFVVNLSPAWLLLGSNMINKPRNQLPTPQT